MGPKPHTQKVNNVGIDTLVNKPVGHTTHTQTTENNSFHGNEVVNKPLEEQTHTEYPNFHRWREKRVNNKSCNTTYIPTCTDKKVPFNKHLS